MPVAAGSALTISVLFKFPNLEQNFPVSAPEPTLGQPAETPSLIKKPESEQTGAISRDFNSGAVFC
jgi:hypothetical protein